MTIPLHAGLAPLATAYDAYICDLWGVLHDGVRAFPEAIDCLERLRERGAKIAVLSNAPRRAAEVEARMNELGVTPGLYDLVLSSGEMTWRHLAERREPWHAQLGRRCYHIGPERDRGIRTGLDYEFVAEVSAADFLLNTGTHRTDSTLEDYADELRAGAERYLPMVCANPDLEVIRGGQREICAGLLAQHYESLGGEVRYHGKPYAEAYEICLTGLGLSDRSRIAALGDSLRTDIAGAKAAGMASLLVAGGIHATALEIREGEMPTHAAVDRLCADAGLAPTACLPVLRW
ncbi:TIGR01459 family HAD-type hydrolase [Algihabitans albus]|uniref:TIGR01459 family HAD-type hydrolase n=1 Tax=Algihabitans albus TaxID=2164067 RepID=UPI000E5D52DA|nr:TIGR01459 family HAD-type hydrolase [Algihabitans albus]